MNFRTHESIEFGDTADVHRLQDRLLREHVRHCSEHSPFYRRALSDAGVHPERIGLDEIRSLPITDKEDLGRENDAFLAAPPSRVVDIVLSSGTTGVPTRIMYTDRDLERLAYNERQSFAAVGIGEQDVILLTCTMDRCFVAGLAYFLGARSLGAAAIRNGHGTMAGHAEIIRRMRPTAVIGVPSFLRKLALFMLAEQGDPRASTVRTLICIGEPLRNRAMEPLPVTRDLTELWDAGVYSTYASSETVTTFGECTAACGGHLHPDLAILELLDESGAPVASGDVGEVVVTPLAVEGMPLLRFRTGDLSFVSPEPCPCGRQSPRLGPILARRKQMIKLKGTTLYPQAIAGALEAASGVVEHYVEVLPVDALSDRVIVHACVSDDSWNAGRIAGVLQARLRVKPDVSVESEDQIRSLVFSPRYRKPMRFVDRRKT